MATILSETKSTGGSPYAYYIVNVTASDRTVNSVKVKVDITGRLSSSSAFLGTGSTMGLIGYILLNGKEYSVTLKTTSQSWSGTTKHTASATFTIEDLEGSQSQLTNIKFRVSRTGSAANDYTKGAAMSSKNCSNLQIGVGHTEPTNVTYVMTEKNQKLIDAGISNDLIVENLSIKEFLFSYTLHDGASFKRCRIWNMASAVYGSDENPFSINLKNQPFPGKYDGKILLFGDVVDSLEGYGASSKIYYDYIPYTSISLNETNTITKRSGQTTGKVKLNVSGTFYNGNIGNINQSGNYKPIIKYKYWKLGDVEPGTFDNIISNENITITNNMFIVTDYEIGSIDETASNYFNPDYAYRVKVYVEDNFTSYTSQEKQIPVGEATWTEYKDRVDFKKASIKGKDIISDIVYSDNQVLWDPGEGKGYYMVASHTINLSQKVSEQKSGIVLVWQAYSNGVVQPYDFNFTFIPKWQMISNSSRGVSSFLTNGSCAKVGTKYVYVHDDKIVGNNANGNGATKRDTGITTTNNYWVLTKVIGV